MKTLTLISCLVSTLIAACWSAQQEPQPPAQRLPKIGQDHAQELPPPQRSAGAFMRAKLVGSQKVLDGLVTEDFQLIKNGAQSMKQMSLAVQWPTADDAVYQHYGTEFRLQCDKLVELADEQNLQGTHYTFLQMTTTCVNCHSYVRKQFRVEPSTTPQGPIRLIPTEWEGQSLRPDRSANATSGHQK